MNDVPKNVTDHNLFDVMRRYGRAVGHVTLLDVYLSDNFGVELMQIGDKIDAIFYENKSGGFIPMPEYKGRIGPGSRHAVVVDAMNVFSDLPATDAGFSRISARKKHTIVAYSAIKGMLYGADAARPVVPVRDMSVASLQTPAAG